MAGWKPYAWLVPIGAVSWTVLGWIFLLSLSPLMWLIALILMTDPGMTDAWLRQLGTSLGAVLLIIVGSPILGALLGAAAVPAGLWGVARVRPRYYLSEELFRTAVARRFAIAMVAPQVALMLLLVALSMLPGQFAWHQLSFTVLAALAVMAGTTAATYFIVRAVMNGTKVLRLPHVHELKTRAEVAQDPAERARLWGILFAQDRRHLPRNTTVVGPRFFVTSALLMVMRHWWVFLTLGMVLAPLWWGVDMVQSFEGMSATMSASQPNAVDPQAGRDVSLVEVALLVLAGLAWLAAATIIPLAVIYAVSVRGREPSDLRTYPSARERLTVNPWEKAVAVSGTVLMVCVEFLILAAYYLVLWVVEGATGLTILWAVVFVGVGVPLSAVATWRVFTRDLRTIVYGPAHWFMRRATPTAAIAPLRGTKAGLEGDPRIAERKARERALKLGLDETATPEQLAQVAAKSGQLPDLGVEEDPYEPWEPGEPERTSEHSIPKGLDDLRR